MYIIAAVVYTGSGYQVGMYNRLFGQFCIGDYSMHVYIFRAGIQTIGSDIDWFYYVGRESI